VMIGTTEYSNSILSLGMSVSAFVCTRDIVTSLGVSLVVARREQDPTVITGAESGFAGCHHILELKYGNRFGFGQPCVALDKVITIKNETLLHSKQQHNIYSIRSLLFLQK